MSELITIGRTAKAHFPDESIFDIPVKIDTGADSSSIWVSQLHMDDDYYLHFVLFALGSPYYSGKVHVTNDYKIKLIKSSNGQVQLRYQVRLSIVLGGRKIRGSFTLADRSANSYPVLVGCKLLKNKFLVDVSLSEFRYDKNDTNGTFSKELRANPRAFFEKYHISNPRGDIKL